MGHETEQRVELDLREPAVAAQYLRICEGVLRNLTVAEAVARFLDEVAERLDEGDPALAEHLRRQRRRLDEEGEVALDEVRGEVAERLRHERDRRQVQLASPRRVWLVRALLLLLGTGIAALLGLAVWGGLRLLGVGSQVSEIAGAVVGLVFLLVFGASVHRALTELTSPRGGRDQ